MENILTIHKTFYKVADFLSWRKNESLVLSPYFQRRSVWDKGAKSYLIDTVYRGLPIPIIFLRDRGVNTKTFEPIREVIDGQQRLRTLISFISPDLLKDYNADRDAFTVTKTHNPDIAGLKFDDLPEDAKQQLLNYEFSVHVIPSSVDDRDIIQIFRRMNSTNFTLKKQELLNAQFFGEFKTSQYLLSAEQLERWRTWKVFTEDEIARMQEVELTSEISITISEKKVLGKSNSIIDKYYKTFDPQYPNKIEIEKRFRETMDFINQNFVGNKNEFVFFKKTIFYTFFITCYDLLFGLNSSLSVNLKPKVISPAKIAALKNKSDLIKGKTAPADVLEASDRRTTNVKERTLLYTFLST